MPLERDSNASLTHVNSAHLHHHTLVSSENVSESQALIDVTRQAISLYKKQAQALHVIYVNLIQFQGKWKAVVSIMVMYDVDGDGKDAIIFGHLPEKYVQHYDDLLPEVDHLNIIDSITMWRNIKKYLLDLHFYQAVHFSAIERITESGGGYFRQIKEKFKIDDGLKLTFDKKPDIKTPIVPNNYDFHEEAEILEIKSQDEDYNILLRNQREGRTLRNLIFK